MIDTLPLTTVGPVVEGEVGDAAVSKECSVCQEEFKEGEVVVELPKCSHRCVCCDRARACVCARSLWSRLGV